jgi:hypothetical protein
MCGSRQHVAALQQPPIKCLSRGQGDGRRVSARNDGVTTIPHLHRKENGIAPQDNLNARRDTGNRGRLWMRKTGPRHFQIIKTTIERNHSFPF